MEEKNFSAKRAKNIIWMLFMTVLLSAVLGTTYHFLLDQIITDFFISIAFFTFFLLCLIHSRQKAMISGNSSSDYSQIRNGYSLLCILIYAFSWLPEFVSPVMLCALFLTAASNMFIGMTVAVYFDIVLCMMVHADFYELCAYILLTLCGCLFAELLREKENRRYLLICLLCIQLTIPALFHFLTAYAFDGKLLIYLAVGGILTDLLIFLFFDKIVQYTEENKARSLKEIIDENYPLVAEIREYSKADYRHAMKVAELCGRCAPLIDVDKETVRAAGFYYRLGRIQGEKPYVQNGVLQAQNECFPPEVTAVLMEYNGELLRPSSRASALVHIVDALVTKFEILDKNTVANTWNYDMVIYQTMNETSATGIYDESGLSMNQFLKIREFFVKGENLF